MAGEYNPGKEQVQVTAQPNLVTERAAQGNVNKVTPYSRVLLPSTSSTKLRSWRIRRTSSIGMWSNSAPTTPQVPYHRPR
jgi:hypothetical protein